MTDAASIKPLQDNQKRASDPVASAWVSANAGAGKTFVLAARVLRLLLAGTPPDRILCLTFTKAAAAEMANRVFAALRDWACADDASLIAQLTALEGRPPDAATLTRARRLFAQALETPGGLKIQTINAFGESLLGRFPFEANVAADFTVIDESETREMLVEARHAVFRKAIAEPANPLGRALDTVTAHANENQISDLVGAVLARRSDFRAWMDHHSGLEGALENLRGALGLDPEESTTTIDMAVLPSPNFPESDWFATADALSDANSLDQKAAEALRQAAVAKDSDDRQDAYLSAFLNKDRTTKKKMPTKLVREQMPDLFNRIVAEKERLEALMERLKAARILEASSALFRLCDEVIRHYDAEKSARGLIDYDDQIEKARLLLTRSRGAAWVLYKLDHGIDHILVDEAQDTNARQWQIVSALSEEFFAGAGARATARSIFAVGDEKQSIYSFQGANPENFDTMRQHFQRATRDVGARFETVPLTTSFRTVPALLSAVDSVFEVAETRAGVATGEDWPAHTATRAAEPGRIELWPVVEPDPDPVSDNWQRPVDAPRPDDPVNRNAERIASVIQSWLRTGERLAPGKPPISPGDILILLRKRGHFATAMNRALKRRGLAVAGADRIKLLDHIAVQDLMALARFILQPTDDLTLAALLKSPLLGLNDDDLIELAPNREGSLLAAVRADPRYQETVERLSHWIERTDQIEPFMFFAEILGAEGGRRAFRARMGGEVDEVLDEFLSLVLRFQTLHASSLQELVRFIEDADIEIKRDMDQAQDEIRVMTVHGAKGLEAPIVFLADTLTKRSASHAPRILALDLPDGAPDAPPPLVWRLGKIHDTEPVRRAAEAEAAAADAESRRLLYVAMTRARDRLYIAGHNTRTRSAADEQDGHWHALLADALEKEAVSVEDPYGLGFSVLRMGDLTDPGYDDGEGVAEIEPVQRPAWLDRPATFEPPPPRLVAPSTAWLSPPEAGARHSEPPSINPLAPKGVHRAAERGRLIHRLLQILPEIDLQERAERAMRFVDRRARDWSTAERNAMVEETLALFDVPDLSPLFSAHSRAEVPVTGMVDGPNGPIQVAGIIDRIAVGAENVIIADFKTNAEPPRAIDDVPEAYVLQVAVYRDLIRRLYPNRSVDAILVWTATASVMPIPSTALDAALRPAT